METLNSNLIDVFGVGLIDVIGILLLAFIIALFARKGLTGFIIGVGGLLALKLLLVLSSSNAVLTIIASVIFGLLLRFIAQMLVPRLRLNRVVENLLGGVGGLAFGVGLILAFSVSLPIGFDGYGRIAYPNPAVLPAGLNSVSPSSRLMKLGSTTTLYEAYVEEGYEHLIYEQEIKLGSKNGIVKLSPQAVKLLHNTLVVGRPWE